MQRQLYRTYYKQIGVGYRCWIHCGGYDAGNIHCQGLYIGNFHYCKKPYSFTAVEYQCRIPDLCNIHCCG